MSRALSQLGGGYYPFPSEHLAALSSLFQPSTYTNSLIIDPCAGEGDALSYLAEKLNLVPYANELDKDRYERCKQRFGYTHATQGPMENLRTPLNAYTVLYINPPYDQNRGFAEEKRRELEMLKDAWKWTQDGGFVVWVVYAHHMSERAARFFVENARDIDIWRIPGLHLDNYPQIVVVARKRPKIKLGDESTDEQQGLHQQILNLVSNCQNPDSLRELVIQDTPHYKLPAPATPKRFYFHPEIIPPDTVLDAILQQGAQTNGTFRTLMAPPPPERETEPAVQPRGGQTGLMVASGLFNGLILNIDDQPAAVRGVSRMVKIETTEPGMEETRRTFQHKAQVTITLLSRNGNITRIPQSDTTRLIAFLRTHQDAFVEYINSHMRPLYRFDYTDLIPVFNRVFRNRPLPNRPVTGLFETQKHAVAAAYEVLKKRKSVILAGEMGSGKGVMGPALIGVLYHFGHIKPGQIAVVMCPPHLTRKWVKETTDAIPGCHVEVVRNVSDISRFLSIVDRRDWQPHIMIVSREMAKLGEGWKPAVLKRTIGEAQWDVDTPLEAIPSRFKDNQTRQLLPSAQRVIRRQVFICPKCGTPIYQSREKNAPPATTHWLERKPRICNYEFQNQGKKVRCKNPLWQFKRTFSAPKEGEREPRKNPRYPLAELLSSRYSDRIAVAAFDELHELKSDSSDQGRSMQRLARAATYNIGLTGTLFGGVASSLFWIEWAFNQAMYELYPITPDRGGRKGAIETWVRTMGVLEQIIEYRQEDRGEARRYSGAVPIEHRPEEAPGISPLLVRHLIDHCIWITLDDLAFDLPPYTEIPVGVYLPDDIQSHYNKGKEDLLDYLIARKMEGDATFLSTYLQALLRYPSSCFREKPVIHKDRRYEVFRFHGFGNERLYPKEEELCKILRAELAEGRPCVVFVDQTNTLDIQPRLLDLIQKHVPDAKPVIMRSGSPDTDKREQWLEEKIAAGMNVLICHPKLVETGLDLLFFKSLIFYEPIYSLYTLSQASRRHWRIGQTHECKVFYLFFQLTMEAQAVELISKKQAAASLLMGDAVGGALAQLSGGADSLEAELAQSIANSSMVVDVNQLFKQEARKSDDFTSGWAQGKTVDEAEIKVVPLDNLIGKFYYAANQLHYVADYGPLHEATYLVHNLSTKTDHLIDARQVKLGTSRFPATPESPVVLSVASRTAAMPATSKPVANAPAIPSADVAPGFPVHTQAKERYPNHLIFIQVGEEVHTYDKDAQQVKKALRCSLWQAGIGHVRATFPASTFDSTLQQLRSAGHTVAVIRTSGTPGPNESEPASTSESVRGPASRWSALYAHYTAAQQKHPDLILFIRIGDYLEVMGDTAELVATQLKLALTSRAIGTLQVPIAAIPVENGRSALDQLKTAGLQPAVIKLPEVSPQAADVAPATATSSPERPTDRLLTTYQAIKARRPDAIPLIQYEGGFRTLGSDAEQVSKTLGLAMTRQTIGGQTWYSVTLSGNTIDRAVERLAEAGITAAVLRNQSDSTPPPEPAPLPVRTDSIAASLYKVYQRAKPKVPAGTLLMLRTANDSYTTFGEDATQFTNLTGCELATRTDEALASVPYVWITKEEAAQHLPALQQQGMSLAVVKPTPQVPTASSVAALPASPTEARPTKKAGSSKKDAKSSSETSGKKKVKADSQPTAEPPANSNTPQQLSLFN